MRLFILLAVGTWSCLAGATLPTKAKAWGAYGHLTVCDLAYRNLTDTARAELNALLRGPDGQGLVVRRRDDVEARRYTSFNVGCLEEDVFPRKHQKDHFLNLDRTTATVDAAVCPTSSSCIFSGIERDLTILRDPTRTREDRVYALMALGHWIGDIHQPLHVSYKDDSGGNGIDAKLAGRCGGLGL